MGLEKYLPLILCEDGNKDVGWNRVVVVERPSSPIDQPPPHLAKPLFSPFSPGPPPLEISAPRTHETGADKYSTLDTVPTLL